MDHDEIISNFVAITGASDHIATHILEAHDWDVDSAINFYLESGGIGHGPFSVMDEGIAAGPQLPQAAPQPSPGGFPASHRLPTEEDEVEIMDEDDDVQIVSTRPAPTPIDLVNDSSDADTPTRRIRRNRPTAAAAIDPELQALQRRMGILGGGNDDEDMIDDPFPRLPSSSRRPTRFNSNNNNQNSINEDMPHLPDDVNLEEQRMLMAALTGQEYQGNIPDFRTDPRYSAAARAATLSPGAQARQMLREEQDAAYYESLAADKEKEEAAKRAEREAEEAEKRAKQLEQKAIAEERKRKEEYERMLEFKESGLPPEPDSNAEDAVMLVVRLPDGRRFGRRFRKSDRFEAVFDFLDVQNKGNEEMKPGSYNLVRQYPRRVFQECGNLTLEDAELVHKQEALFIEMK